MEFQGRHSEHDALDEILRRYLLENEANGPEGEDLMEAAADRVLAQPALVTPTPEKEAALLERLRASFPADPAPAPEAGLSPGLKYGLVSMGVIAVLLTAFLLIFNPFSEENPTDTYVDKGTEVPSHQPLAGEAAREDGDVAGPQENITSLHDGDDNASSVMNPGDSKGTSLERERRPKRQLPGTVGTGIFPFVTPNGSNPSPVSPDQLTDSQDGITPSPVAVADPYPLRGLFAQTHSQSKFYLLEAKQDHIISGHKGTILHIPRDAFVDASSGEAATGLIQVEIKEIYKRSEFLRSNLSTLSNGRPLVSGGAVYVDARAAGRRLSLAKGKDLYIEFAPSKNGDTRDMQLAHGTVDDRGEVNWVPAGKRFGKMIPLPPGSMFFDEFECDCSSEGYWNKLVWEISGDQYANTWIATREFRQRLRVLRDVGYFARGLRTYMDHVHQPLWEADKLVAELLREDARGIRTREEGAEKLQRFSQQMLTTVEPFDDRGVDLDRWDARRQLMYRSVSRSETESLMRVHKLRQSFLEEIESRLVVGHNAQGKYFIAEKKHGTIHNVQNNPLQGHLITSLGWNNLMKVVNNEFADHGSRTLKVRLNGEVPYETTSVFLVYQKMKTIVPGRLTTGQLFRFTNVPDNAEAWIVAIGYRGGMPYIGIDRLPQKGAEHAVITMERRTLDGYLNSLAVLDQ